MTTKKGTPKNTEILLAEIRKLVLSARNMTVRSINLLQVSTNFQIGKLILEHEQKGRVRALYGKEVLKALSKRLTSEFGRGYSEDSLANMRKFYLTYKDQEKVMRASQK